MTQAWPRQGPGMAQAGLFVTTPMSPALPYPKLQYTPNSSSKCSCMCDSAPGTVHRVPQLPAFFEASQAPRLPGSPDSPKLLAFPRSPELPGAPGIAAAFLSLSLASNLCFKPLLHTSDEASALRLTPYFPNNARLLPLYFGNFSVVLVACDGLDVWLGDEQKFNEM
ncbi:hypothetical protein AOQ84DRAFT_223840 [Glonium stellatum]|uniref:Uncharacterized protein n=1 Tax=Glonium stellatum TaxID=574774 RepID=A0A8E2JY48_9PEZI|nr:hypothetical protein AOQ84DRAFT_223840 [Glonium stellatum]